MDVSERVGTDWRMVVRILGITDTEIEEIESRYQKVNEKSYEGFYLWVDKNGGFDRANPNEIKAVLLNLNLSSIAYEFFDM